MFIRLSMIVMNWCKWNNILETDGDEKEELVKDYDEKKQKVWGDKCKGCLCLC